MRRLRSQRCLGFGVSVAPSDRKLNLHLKPDSRTGFGGCLTNFSGLAVSGLSTNFIWFEVVVFIRPRELCLAAEGLWPRGPRSVCLFLFIHSSSHHSGGCLVASLQGPEGRSRGAQQEQHSSKPGIKAYGTRFQVNAGRVALATLPTHSTILWYRRMLAGIPS